MEITKLVSCEEVSLRRCEMMYAPSGEGSSVGGDLYSSGVVMLSVDRKEFPISMPRARASRRYPWAMLWVCADIDGSGRDVEDCTSIVVRHQGAQCASPAGQSEGGAGG